MRERRKEIHLAIVQPQARIMKVPPTTKNIFITFLTDLVVNIYRISLSKQSTCCSTLMKMLESWNWTGFWMYFSIECIKFGKTQNIGCGHTQIHKWWQGVPATGIYKQLFCNWPPKTRFSYFHFFMNHPHWLAHGKAK